VSSAGLEVAEFAATAGLVLDPWQVIVLDVMLGERADGKWAAREVGYLVARQNGKGGVLNALALGALFLFDDEQEILFSAHEFKTAKKAYRDIKALIQGAPHLAEQVERRGTRVVGFRQSNEDTSITLQSGAVLRFMARSNNTARGFSPQRLIVDEAQECSEDTRQALLYTVSAQDNPQIVFTGTVPSPRNNGDVWKSLRDRGRAGGDTTLAWLEWTPEPDVDPRSDEAVEWSNPSCPHRVTPETILAERNGAVSDEAWAGFCRERLSIWPDDALSAGWAVVSAEAWAGCASQETEVKSARPGWLKGKVAIAVEMPPDRSSVSIGAAGVCREGGIGLEVVAHGSPPNVREWVAAQLLALTTDPDRPVSRVAVDPKSPAGSLLDPIPKDAPAGEPRFIGGVEVILCTTDDIVKATGDLHDAILSGEVVHRDRPELNAAVASASKRTVGDAWLLDRRSATDVSPFGAVNLARWAHLLPASESVALAAVYA